MQAYKLLSIRGLCIVWLQVSKTNKYMLNFKQMSCSKRKGFREKLELSIFYKELKHMYCFQMSLLTGSKHPDIWIWWCTVLHLNQTQYSCLFNRNTEYLKYSRTIISGQKKLDFLTGFWSFYSGGQQRSSKSRIYSVFRSSWFLWLVFQKNVFWLFLSESCIEILFLLSKEIIHITTSHQHCLINGIVKICSQHPTFLKSGTLRTTAAAFLAWGAGVWPPTSRMFSPCIKIMQVYSATPKNRGNE